MDYIARFRDCVRKYPQRTAVTDDGGELTYLELDLLSASLAERLRSAGAGGGDTTGVQPAAAGGDAVGVLLPRTTDIVAAALAAIRSGGVYLPMDPAYPSDRLSFMLKDSDAKVLLTTRSLYDSKELEFPADRVIFMEEFQADSKADRTADVPHAAADPAYLLYTSGTTGRPKGVLHTHGSLLAMATQWGPESPDDSGFDSTGVVAGFTFIASAFMMFPPLIIGGCCNIVPENARTDMNALNEYVGRRGIRQLFLPASLAAAMAEEFPLDGVTIFSAGEKLRNFRKKGSADVINAYGSTEGVVVLAAHAAGDELDIPLGKPAGGVTARLVDENMADVADGEIGELIYTGGIMAERYLGLEEQTAAKWFVADGKRWYRTGDRMRIDGNGEYHYVGRADNMVKIRGFRVETGEVENSVRAEHPSMEEIAVVLRSVHGIDHLCCYYKSPDQVDTGSLKAGIARRLAEYMVPDVWIRLDKFPLNANGKIMRSALPAPQMDIEGLSALYSEVELRVEEAARIVLGLDSPVDIDDSFVDLGGDSLRAMKLASTLSEQGIRVTGSQILRLKVLRRIAGEADVAYERLWTPEQYTEVKYRFGSRGEKILQVLPLTNGQDDMLYDELIYPDSCDNRTVYVLEIDSALDGAELSEAVGRAAEENDGLRAAVVYQGVSVFQQVITDRKLPCHCIDLSEEADPFDRIAGICETMRRAPIDLEESPALETVYVRHSKGGCLLFRVLHVSLGMDGVRRGICSILRHLQPAHPDDSQMNDWIELLSEAAGGDVVEARPGRTSSLAARTNRIPDEIAVFSEGKGQKKVVFVHTGNTGSDAYYQLADKIGGVCGFSVIESYNLYHPEAAIDGIRSIASKYVEILRRQQPSGPYFLGGWCYGGVVAHEMACQLEAAGEKVEHLVMLDSHVTVDPVAKQLFGSMSSFNKREYFETSPLFADLRAQGLLESVVSNSRRVARNLAEHVPTVFHGPVTYFKPQVTPAGISGDSLKYWQEMMKHRAGGYEDYCTDIKIIPTPHEHDLMMDKESLAIIVPEMLSLLK